MIFKDRRDAGKQLAQKLILYKDTNAVVVALPRGGVPVGYEIANALHVPLTVLPVRKIGAPFNREYAIGAITVDNILYIDKQAIGFLEISKEQINVIIAKEREELERQKNLYDSSLQVNGKTVILVDDGLATGLTAQAAIAAIKNQKPKKIILAVPGCPAVEVVTFDDLVEEFFCLEKREDFTAVGDLYSYFEQVPDEEVLFLLGRIKK